ncbi:MAG: DEAD/DEAH box helicase, partial [Pseudobdellovibrionaceae bacterium]
MTSNDFLQFPFKEKLQSAIAAMGYTTPTQIQTEVITSLLAKEKQDMVALAQTGSGKTSAFGFPLAQKLDPSLNALQALVLSPTRELAAQIDDEFKKFMPAVGLRVMALYGGQSYLNQKAKLKNHHHVIVATPGRLVDLINQNLIDLTQLKALILDEADRMLSMGFEDDLKFLLGKTHEASAEKSSRASCQTWLFSATMGHGIKRILNKYLSEPVVIEQTSANQGISSTIKHHYVAIKPGHRAQALLRVMSSIPEFYGIIFCQTKREVAEVEQSLRDNKISCMSLHGEKLQKEREHILKSLKQEKFSVLIATDVAARGLDVKNLKHVIHYTIPIEIESYVHRSGRTGRNGEDGMVISLVETHEFSRLNRLVRSTKIEPTPFELKNSQELLKEAIKREYTRIQKMKENSQQFKKIKSSVGLILELGEMEDLQIQDLDASDWLSFLITSNLTASHFVNDDVVIKDFSISKEPRKSFGGSGRPRSSGGYSSGGYERPGRSRGGFSSDREQGSSRPYRGDRQSDNGGSSSSYYRRDELPARESRPRASAAPASLPDSTRRRASASDSQDSRPARPTRRFEKPSPSAA